MHFTLDFSSSSKTGFLGRGGGEGIRVLSIGMSGSDCTMPETGQGSVRAGWAALLPFLTQQGGTPWDQACRPQPPHSLTAQPLPLS